MEQPPFQHLKPSGRFKNLLKAAWHVDKLKHAKDQKSCRQIEHEGRTKAYGPSMRSMHVFWGGARQRLAVEDRLWSLSVFISKAQAV